MDSAINFCWNLFSQLGAEQEWKLAQCNIKDATEKLLAVSSQLSSVSAKTKSSLGLTLLI